MTTPISQDGIEFESVSIEAHETTLGDTLYVAPDDYTQGDRDDYPTPEEGSKVAYIEVDDDGTAHVCVGVYHDEHNYEVTDHYQTVAYRKAAIIVADEALMH